jgi:hypothetical protein
MWIVCKRRRIDPLINKRKKVQCQFIQPVNKKPKLRLPEKLKRSIIYIEQKLTKKIKTEEMCILHENRYICDIYECNGVKDHIKYMYMPYIN